MREIRLSGSEGGAGLMPRSYLYLIQNPWIPNRQNREALETCLAIFIVLGLVAAFFIWNHVRMYRHGRNHDQTEATCNARQIGLALFEFETEYGAFPNASTIPLVEKENGTAIDLTGTSSNALFRQLFAAQITQSEQMFYARTGDTRKTDGDITPGNILEPGDENGFSYISGLSTADDPLTPIALTPLIPGTITFDPKPFHGKAVVLYIDCSVRSFKIAKDGHIYDKGIDLLSSKHPIWKGKIPDIRCPE